MSTCCQTCGTNLGWRHLPLAIPERPTSAWTCDAKGLSGVEPQECNWPLCGCDPHAEKVISALIECGWKAP